MSVIGGGWVGESVVGGGWVGVPVLFLANDLLHSDL